MDLFRSSVAARQASRRRLYLLLGLAALALVLRLIRLDFQPLWWDEGYSVFFATRDLPTMLARTAIDIHPPFYYGLLQLWIPLAGKSDVALRLFSVLIGLAALPLVYWLGSRLYDARLGLVTALLLAISPFHIYYSQEVRMYGLVTLLALGSMLLQVKLLHDSGGRGKVRWFLYVFVTAAALYTQYFAAFLLAAEMLIVAAARRSNRQLALRPWLLAWAVVILLTLPWLSYAGPKLYAYVTAKVGIEQFSPLDPLSFLGQQLVAFSVGHVSGLFWLGLGGGLVLIALALFGLTEDGGRRTEDEGRKTGDGRGRTKDYPLLYLFVPLLLGWLVNLVYPFHPIRYERLLLFAAPAIYLLVARGVDALLRRDARLGRAALAALALVSFVSLLDFYTVERYAEEDYRPLIREMESLAREGDLVLAPYPWQIGYLESYYRGPTLRTFEVPAEEWGRAPSKIESGLGGLRASAPRVWLLAFQTQGRRLEDQLANFYADDYVLYDDWFGHTRLEYFGQAADPPLSETAADFGADLHLISFGTGVEPVTPGAGYVRIRLHWVGKAEALNYSLRLVGPNGDKALQKDGPLAAGNLIARIGLVVPRELPPGDYAVQLVVYRQSDGSPLPPSSGGNQLTLGSVTISR